MLRGLIIRQVFILVDAALAVLALVTVGMVVYRLFGGGEAVLARDVPAYELAAGPAVYQPMIASRNAYERIRSNGLFGPAGRWDPSIAPAAPPEPEPEPEEIIEETRLNLRLIGTLATYPKDPLGSANIEKIDQRAVVNVAIGREVMEDVLLDEVHPRSVYILNQGRRERLSMDDEDAGQTVQARAASPAPRADTAPDRVTINRQEFIQDLYMNYADLVTNIRPEYYRDATGRVVGLTAQNISQVPLARQLQLQDGDVLQSVNNEMIDSEQKVLEIIQKYRNANSFRIGILRNGRPQVITYRLD